MYLYYTLVCDCQCKKDFKLNLKKCTIVVIIISLTLGSTIGNRIWKNKNSYRNGNDSIPKDAVKFIVSSVETAYVKRGPHATSYRKICVRR